jgi:hypothetical protein
MSDESKFYGVEISKYIEESAQAGLKAAAEFYVSKIKESLDTPYPPPSDPFTPPHWRSRDIYNSITSYPSSEGGAYEFGVDGSLIGSDMSYAPFLEIGTMDMLPRPFIMPIVIELLTEAGDIASKAAQKRMEEHGRS